MEFTPDVYPDMPHLKGPALIAFVLTTVLYGCNIGAVASYVQFSWDSDRKGTRMLVLAVAFVATLSMILSLLTTIRQFAIQFGKAPVLLDLKLTLCSQPLQGWMHVLVAGYFARRAWKMYGRPLWMALALGAILAATAAGTMGSWISGMISVDGAQTVLGTVFILMMIITQVAGDVIVSTLIVIKLIRTKTGFKQTDTLIRRLVYIGIETQAPPALFAIAFLIVFLGSKHETYSLAFTCFPQVYAMSLLAALNSRFTIKSKLENEVSVGWREESRSRRTLPMNSINVHTETYTHADAADHLDTKRRPVRGAGASVESTESLHEQDQDSKDLNTSEIRLV